MTPIAIAAFILIACIFSVVVAIACARAAGDE